MESTEVAFLTLRMDSTAQFEYAWCVGEAIEQTFPRTWALFFEGMAARLAP